MYIDLCIFNVFLYTHIYIYIYVYIHIYMYVCIYMYTYGRMSVARQHACARAWYVHRSHWNRCQAPSVQIRESRPDSGLAWSYFSGKRLASFQAVPSWLESGVKTHVCMVQTHHSRLERSDASFHKSPTWPLLLERLR